MNNEERLSNLVQAQKDYIEFLGRAIQSNAGYLYAHGINTPESVVKEGEELRKRISDLEE